MKFPLQHALSSADSLDDVSAKSGVSSVRLSELASGADPSMAELRALSRTLRVSVQDLAPLPPVAERANVLFRTGFDRKKTPGPPVVDALSRRMGYSLELLASENNWWARRFEGLPKSDPEAFASHFRELFLNGDQVSPLLALPTLMAEQLRIVLFVINAAHMEGASAFISGIPFVFVSRRFPGRMLFTCAHELGHLLAHHEPNSEFAIFDGEGVIDHSNKSHEERFAHSFASALLLPRAGLGIALNKVRKLANVPPDDAVGDIELLYASRIFGVSFEVAARRCEDLQLLPKGAARSLNEKLKEEYGSAEKRAESLKLPPRPEVSFQPVPNVLLASVVEKIRGGELSVGRASMMLGLSIGDLLAANAAASS